MQVTAVGPGARKIRPEAGGSDRVCRKAGKGNFDMASGRTDSAGATGKTERRAAWQYQIAYSGNFPGYAGKVFRISAVNLQLCAEFPVAAFVGLIREGWKHARAARIEKFYRLRARAGQVEGVVGVFHGGTMGVQ